MCAVCRAKGIYDQLRRRVYVCSVPGKGDISPLPCTLHTYTLRRSWSYIPFALHSAPIHSPAQLVIYSLCPAHCTHTLSGAVGHISPLPCTLHPYTLRCSWSYIHFALHTAHIHSPAQLVIYSLCPAQCTHTLPSFPHNAELKHSHPFFNTNIPLFLAKIPLPIIMYKP